MKIKIELKEKQILDKVTNDEVGLFTNKSWKRLIDPFTPELTGLLMGRIGNTVDLSVPFQIHYKATQDSGGSSPAKSYASYVYNSKGWNFKKPGATDHWDIKAEQAGQKEKLIREINAYLRSGNI